MFLKLSNISSGAKQPSGMRSPASVAVWPLIILVAVVISSAAPAQAARKVSEPGVRRESLDSSTGWKAEQDGDRIAVLPGQPPVDFAMYAGYITVNKEAGRAHYYYLVEAAEEPQEKPLMFWFNGGPGCSSIGTGFAQLLGPFFINPDGKTLRRNPNSANKHANVLFLDSPAGVGFSYTNTSSDILTSGDNRTAHDNYAFVVNWLERFPQYKGRPLFLSGESYAGVYVPQLAKLIYNNNEKLSAQDKINFQGFLLGNPVIAPYYDQWLGFLDYTYYNSIISERLYSETKTVCKEVTFETYPNITGPCLSLLADSLSHELGNIDIYAAYAPTCINATTPFGDPGNFTARFNHPTGFHRFLQAYDPCTYNYAAIYFNRPDVQKAMHANTTGIPYPWSGCSSQVLANWQDRADTLVPVYRELLGAGNLRLWVFSGDTDVLVPTIGTRYALSSMNLPVVVPWYPWYHKQQVGGREIVYEGNLTLVTVRGGSHAVPKLRGAEFLQIMKAFLTGSLLPSDPYQ